MGFLRAFPSHVGAAARTGAGISEGCPASASLSLCLSRVHRREAQTHVSAQPRHFLRHLPLPASTKCPHPSSLPAPLRLWASIYIYFIFSFFFLDFLSILVAVHHKLARENRTFPPNFFFFFKKPSSRGMWDVWSWAAVDSPANYIYTRLSHSQLSNDKQIWDFFFLLCSIYHYAPRLYFSLTCSIQANINKLSIYACSFPSMKLIRNLGNAGDLKINLSYNYWHKLELLMH